MSAQMGEGSGIKTRLVHFIKLSSVNSAFPTSAELIGLFPSVIFLRFSLGRQKRQKSNCADIFESNLVMSANWDPLNNSKDKLKKFRSQVFQSIKDKLRLLPLPNNQQFTDSFQIDEAKSQKKMILVYKLIFGIQSSFKRK